MDELIQLLQSEHKGEIIITLVAAVLVVQFIVKILDFFRERFGITTAAMRREKEQSEAITEIEKETKELLETQEQDHEEMRNFQKEIKDILNGIQKQILDDKIERMRYEILDFANAASVRKYSKESYDHVLSTYSAYANIIKQKGIENGQVDLAIDFIKKKYAAYLEEGFPTY